MGNKKVIISVAVLLIAGAIFIVSEKLTSLRPPEHRTLFFPGLEERHVSAITIRDRSRGAVRIEKNGDTWIVSDANAPQTPVAAATDETTGDSTEAGDDVTAELSVFPANPVLVQIAVERIVTLKRTELISENPTNQPAFGVDTAGASSIEIFTSDKTAPAHVLRVGKSGPDWNSNYVRLTTDDAVYLVAGGLRQALFLSLEQWKKPTPPPEPEPEIENIIEGELTD